MKKSLSIRSILIIFLFSLIHFVSAQSERTVGVLEFYNEGGSTSAWLAKGIKEVIYDKLGEISAVSVYEKETLNRVLKKSGIHTSKSVDGKVAFSIGKQTGCEVLYLGSYKLQNNQVSVSFKMVSTYTGSPIFQDNYEGDLTGLLTFLTNAVKNGLSVMQVSIHPNELRKIELPLTTSMKAFEQYSQAYLEIDHRSPMEVIAGHFQRALMEDPGFLEAQYNLGVIYYNSKFYDKALAQFNAAINTDSKFYKAYYGKGVINYLQKEYLPALREFQKSLSINPNHDRSYYYTGIIYTRIDSLNKGIHALEKSIDLNPNYAPAHFELGVAEMERGWYKRAITSLTKATQLDPDFYRAINALGEAYYALNLYEEAIIEFNKAIKLRPKYATAHFNLGNSIYRRGALAEIVDAFWSLLEVQYAGASGTNGESSNITPIAGLENLREKSRISDESVILRRMVSSYRIALAYDQRFYEASYNLALTYENLANPDSAEFYYKLAIRQKPDLAQAHMRLGKIYENRANYRMAFNEYKEVVKYEPDYFSANPKLGEPYRYVNIIETVLNENIAALDRNPGDKAALEVVGKIYLSLGRYGQAKEYYEKLLAVNPDNDIAQRTLKRIRRQLQKL